MINEKVDSLEFVELTQRVYCTDLGKYLEPGTILLPLASIELHRRFIIMNEKAWTHKFTGATLDTLTFPFSMYMSSGESIIRPLGPHYHPKNPLTPEEIKLFRTLYEA